MTFCMTVQVREERVVLEDEAHMPPLGGQVDAAGCVEHRAIANGDPAGVGPG